MSSLYKKIKSTFGRTRVPGQAAGGPKRYQPEKYFMRGPGPKTLAKREAHPQANGS